MDAIETRFMGATNTRGSRIKATTLGNNVQSVTVAYDHALNAWDNHRAAAETLIQKLGWLDTSFYGGETAHGSVWVADIGSQRFIRCI
jgi:uncharacterized protein (DUF1501 family)